MPYTALTFDADEVETVRSFPSYYPAIMSPERWLQKVVDGKLR
jgi:hypothetical protein